MQSFPLFKAPLIFALAYSLLLYSFWYSKLAHLQPVFQTQDIKIYSSEIITDNRVGNSNSSLTHPKKKINFPIDESGYLQQLEALWESDASVQIIDAASLVQRADEWVSSVHSYRIIILWCTTRSSLSTSRTRPWSLSCRGSTNSQWY